jgi:Flp pilus assembly protein TadG
MRAWRNRSADRLRDDSGQSMVELGLVLPMFFAMAFGFINICMAMFGLCNLSFACQHAVRYACLHSSTSLSPASQSTIDTQVAPFIFKYPSNTHSDTLSYAGSGNVVGGTATVAVSITYSLMVLPFAKIPAVTLSSSASGTIIQ